MDRPAGPTELAAPDWALRQSEAASANMIEVAVGFPRLLGQGLALAWSASRMETVVVLASSLLSGVFTALGLLVTTKVLGYLLTAGPAMSLVAEAWPALAALALTVAAAGGARNVTGWVLGRIGPKVDRLVELRFVSLSTKVDLAAFDEPDFHDAMHRARERGIYEASAVVSSILSVLGGLIGVVSAALAIAVMHPLLLVVLALAVIPDGWAAVRAAKMRYGTMYALSESRRRKWLLLDLMAGRQAAAELRSFTMRNFLLAEYDNVVIHVRDRLLRVADRQTVVKVLGDAASAAGMCLVYASLMALLAGGYVPLTIAGAAVFAIRSGQSSLKGVLLAMNSCYESGLYLGDFSSFCAKAEKRTAAVIAEPAAVDPGVIRLEDVCFHYFGAAEPAISSVTLELNKGELVALVGENGSGKTTLAKLLAGLYSPTSGSIAWGGTPIDAVDPEELRSKIAVVSQDFIGWPFSARHNVSMADRADEGRLDSSCAAAGADEVIRQLPMGYATILDHRFVGGHELSGGQWQRIALARGFYRDSRLLICDEPTSALDARAEERVFRAIRTVAPNRTTILITHRLANVVHADRIYVLDHGKIVETGTHEELMCSDTKYRELFTLQGMAYHHVSQPI